MPSTQSSRQVSSPDELPTVNARVTYLAAGDGPVQVRVYPPGSGRTTVRPPSVQRDVDDPRRASDRGPPSARSSMGSSCTRTGSQFTDFYDEAAVRARYYPEVEAAMRAMTGALAVIVFDHNVRSAARAARGEVGVRLPVDQVHNDYTEQSGPKRKREILDAAGRSDLADRHVAFVNLWRPIVGPVWDNPLAVCDAGSVSPEDLVDNRHPALRRGRLDGTASQRPDLLGALQPRAPVVLRVADATRRGPAAEVLRLARGRSRALHAPHRLPESRLPERVRAAREHRSADPGGVRRVPLNLLQAQARLPSMYDLLIRAGTIVDGSGNAAFTGDVAVQDGRIVAVGRVEGPARRTLDADGLLVTPGFVDVHTHYDGQATWDPLADAELLARRHHRGDGQLRRRLRADEERTPRVPDRADGGRRGHSRGCARRRRRLGLGELPRVSRRARRPSRASWTWVRSCRMQRCATT